MVPSPRSTVHTPKAMPPRIRTTSKNPATTAPKPLDERSSSSAPAVSPDALAGVCAEAGACAEEGACAGALSGAGAGSTFVKTVTVWSSSSAMDEDGVGACEEKTAIGAALVSSPSSSS